MSRHRVIEAAAVRCEVGTADWAFARDEAEAIAANWRRRTAANPDLWNGRVLLLRDGEFDPGPRGPVFRGQCFESDFSTFLGWRDAGFPPTGVRNIFSMAALETADGAFVLGEMAAHTAPAGQVYFPSGTPDPKDVVGNLLDLEASARRELQEETGLDPGDVEWIDGMTLVMSDIRLCCMKRTLAPFDAVGLVARIDAWLAMDPKSELARMHIVRGPDDITPAMPSFVVTYLRHRFAAQGWTGSASGSRDRGG